MMQGQEKYTIQHNALKLSTEIVGIFRKNIWEA